jgi:Zn-dependent protease
MFNLSVIQKIAIYIIPIIFAVTLHEAAHAYMAKKYGDNTAQLLGRLSLNPLHHIDILGTIIVPLFGIILGGVIFGWAKPVPINYFRLKNIRRDSFWISFAGPLTNLAQALIWALVFKFTYQIHNAYFGMPLNMMAQAGIGINISLMLLNLLPILPLDGGRMLASVLPPHLAISYIRLEPYGMWILFGLLLIGGLTFIISPLYMLIVQFIFTLIQ